MMCLKSNGNKLRLVSRLVLLFVLLSCSLHLVALTPTEREKLNELATILQQLQSSYNDKLQLLATLQDEQTVSKQTIGELQTQTETLKSDLQTLKKDLMEAQKELAISELALEDSQTQLQKVQELVTNLKAENKQTNNSLIEARKSFEIYKQDTDTVIASLTVQSRIFGIVGAAAGTGLVVVVIIEIVNAVKK